MNQATIDEHKAKCDAIRPKLIDGPWMAEPDRLNWKAHGLDCMIVRAAVSFSLCGYVGVPKSHPLYNVPYSESNSHLQSLLNQLRGKSLDQIELTFARMLSVMGDGGAKPSPEVVFEVHGGLTYSDFCGHDICHIDDDAQAPTWWFGFDCAHCNDYSPALDASFRDLPCAPVISVFGPQDGVREYRTIDYVKAEVESLAEQLAAVA